MSSEYPRVLSINFYKSLKIIYFNKFSNASLMHSVKRSRKLATATALLFWLKCLEFRGRKTFLFYYCFTVTSTDGLQQHVLQP